jgi:hypothetical protein
VWRKNKLETDTPEQKALQARGIDKMLKEARDDNRENDNAHMRPVSHFDSGLYLTTS